MKLPNGYGSVKKLSGKRRKPFAAMITKEYAYDEAREDYVQKQVYIGYYKTRAEALKALADYHDAPFDLNNVKITFSEVYDLVKPKFTEARKANYYAAYKYCTLLYNMPIRDIKTAHLQQVIDSCKTTQQREIKTVFNKVFAYAMKNDIINKNPAEYVTAERADKVRERKVFTSEEIAKIEQIGEWWSKLVIILLYEGMRTKELIELPIENIDLEEKVIHITTAKNKSSVRDIPIHTHVLPLILDFIKEGDNFPFKSKSKAKYTHDQINHALAQYGHTVYETRHTFATQGRLCGIDELVMQRLLGHTPKTITHSIYTHLTLDEMRIEIEKLKF